jgi:penicillin-binding protein 1C
MIDSHACTGANSAARPPSPWPSPGGRGRRISALFLLLTPPALLGIETAQDAHLQAPAPTPIILDRSGAFLAQAGHVADDRTEYGYWTTPPPPRVIAATLALEDRRFWQHPGVDPIAVAHAAWSRLHGGRSGASTIAMQVARLQHPRPRTAWAKLVEAGTALALTARYGRDAVLAQYLRLAPYGSGSHGIGHAARWYFDKPAADLGWAEAALLAAIPQAPALANPRQPTGLARAARRAARALALLPLDPGQARRDLANLRPVPAPRRPDNTLQAALRLERLAREAAADPADPRLRATLDLRVQAGAMRHLRLHLAAWRTAGAQQAAVMVVRRETGEVLADAASAGWATRPGGAMDYSAASRSPGSTLKPFLYALALDDGTLSPSDVMADAPEGAGGIANADGDYLGPLLPRQALANSRNVPAATLLAHIGLERGFDMLRRAGLHRDAGPARSYGLGLAVGALPTRLDWLVRAYGALANDGMLRDLAWLQDQPAGPPTRLFSRDAARLVAAFLSDPMARLPSFPRYGPSEYPFAVALKTGTSQQYRDSWTVAWSSRYIVGVWAGRPDAGPMAGLSGARAAARLAQTVLLDLHGAGRTDLLASAFDAPAGRGASELCTGTGRPGACSQHLTEWVRPGAAAPPAPVPHLAITEPQPDAHVWRNPDAPPALQRLALRATVVPPVEQVVWLVDGEPAAVAHPDQPFLWPMRPGLHRFQVRLPLQDAASRQVRVVVE